MGLRRFYLLPEQKNQPESFLEGDEARHILKVLRLGAGDPVVLFDGTGWEGLARIARVEGGKIYLSIREQRFLPKDSLLKIRLAVPLIRPQPLEWILQKGTELGVFAFIPYYSTYSGPKAFRQDGGEKRSRWERIIAAAGKQCGRNRLPILENPVSLDRVLESEGTGLRIIPYEEETAYTFRNLADNTPKVEEVLACIGPEGGFSPDEIKQAREKKFLPLSLGPRVLRSETAALALVTLLQFTWGDLSEPYPTGRNWADIHEE
ncbi:MAG: 16S rRNA (uracil(1498)-N(3))-methyltransferase [Deltaproteobacteria bacterium]|nr:16S rRNA (uracil(1498)-N(3))-methyltransferase [Deltaproteobacteria bacterium]